MQLALIAFALLAVLELWLYSGPGWRLSRQLTVILIPLLVLDCLVLLLARPRLAFGVVLFLSLYRALNLLRVFKQRIQPDYLHRSAGTASLWLIAAQLLMMGFGLSRLDNGLAWLYGLSLAQLIAAAVLVRTAFRQRRAANPPQIKEHLTEAGLPTLTVAIPARNETSDLAACLESLVASNYPKLEIIVLDDDSQDRRTPEIIRSFAQSGVKFLEGAPVPGHWLAKNFAYKQLADAANGEYILFCGVDVRFKPDSLRHLVEAMLAKHKSMICVMPRNIPTGGLRDGLLQPSRYAWELSLPRRLLNRPPVLSTCWLISTGLLRDSGGFEAVSRKIIPESYFARLAAKTQDSYSFIHSDSDLGIVAQKSISEQKSTAIRTRYPQLHKRLELTAFIGLGEFVVLLWPLPGLAAGALIQDWLLCALAIIGGCLAIALYGIIMETTYQKYRPTSLWQLPLAAAYDIYILNLSMWQYEFDTVYWKGRPINQPVMRLTKT